MACVRPMVDGKVTSPVKTFKTTTQELMALSDWLSAESVTHVGMEATGVYWKPVWHILSDGEFELVLANAACPNITVTTSSKSMYGPALLFRKSLTISAARVCTQATETAPSP